MKGLNDLSQGRFWCAFFAAQFAVAHGVILEWLLDSTVGTRWFGSPSDTAKDVILGTLGSIALVVWRRRTASQALVEAAGPSGDTGADGDESVGE